MASPWLAGAAADEVLDRFVFAGNRPLVKNVMVAGRWVVAGREVHAIHIVAPEELDPARESAMVSDPEASEVRRPLIGAAREQYLEAFGAWRESIAHDWSDAGTSYTMAVPGDETTEHLIRRIAAVRNGGAAIA